jgi:hypothetical protein
MANNNDSLQFHLTTERGTGNIKDGSGMDNAITVQGSPIVLGNEDHDNCINFNGSSDYVQVPEITADFSKGLTVEAWVYYDRMKRYARIIDFGNGVDRNNIILANYESTKMFLFSIKRNGDHRIYVNGLLETGKWMHLAVTVDENQEATIYKNGKIVAGPKDFVLPESISRTKCYVGKSNWGNNALFDGKIADLRIYNRALTQEEIQMDMTQGALENNLPAYDTVFGKMDFKKGDEGRSVYSPAAYLTDLLQIMDDEFDPSNPVNESFDQRRADIREIILNAENTFTVIPYLDIVNDVLEKRVGTDPYKVLAKALFPMNLPFDLANEKIKICLKYLDVTAEQLYKLFALQEVSKTVAREHLGLSEEELDVILDQSGETLLGKYGNPAAKAELSPVESFMEATGISGLELRELLFQNLSREELGVTSVGGTSYYLQEKFFVNHQLNGYAKLDLQEENITWNTAGTAVPDAWFERAHRLIRLSKKTGLSITDLDIILRDVCGSTLDESAILKIAVIKNIADTNDMPVDEVCAFFATINTIGHSEEKDAADLFDRLLNGRYTEFSKQYILGSTFRPHQYKDSEFTTVTYTGDILAVDNKNYRKRLHCALGISEKDLTLIVKKFRAREVDETLWSTPANQLNTLSLLFRLKKLVEILDSSFDELFHIFDVLEKDPLIRQYNHFNTLIHYAVTEPDCYKIITAENIDNSFWLVQTVMKLVKWMQANDFTGEELKKIASGDYTEKIEINPLPKEKDEKTEEEIAREQKIRYLDAFYQQYKTLFFGEELFLTNPFDKRSARIIYDTVLESNTLVSKKDNRLVFFNEEDARQAAYRAVNRFDIITRDDFFGLGIEEKIADKIFKNLVLKGYISTSGIIDEEKFADIEPDSFEIDTDFSSLKQKLFDKIVDLSTRFVDVAIFPSDLKDLQLEEAETRQLYDNLVLNGFLDEKGALLQPAIFEDKEGISSFEPNAHIGNYSNIGSYAADVLDTVKDRMTQFDHLELTLDKEIFEGLPLDEIEIDDLVENLRFNEYIDEENVFVDNKKMQETDVRDFSLALQFYPHRRAILKAIQDYLTGHRADFYTVDKDIFRETAENIIADWCFKAVNTTFLEEGRLKEEKKEFFKNRDNLSQFDIWWSFEPNDNAVVFEALRNIVLTLEKYTFNTEPLKEWDFSREETDRLVENLQTDGILDENNKIPQDKTGYFMNIDNALVFEVNGFEDYSQDVFFLLHAVAGEVDAGVNTIINQIKNRSKDQETQLYSFLQEPFGLHSDSIRVISREVFKGEPNEVESWLLPILSAVGIRDEIIAEPADYKFNAAYKRILQFALLASKLKLSREEIDIAFIDQNLVEKYPENLAMPEGITSFDALLQNEVGVHIFKGTQYWLSDPVTYQLVEKEDGSSRTISEITQLLKNAAKVDAAFVDNDGNSIIIAGQLYLVKKKDETVWKLKEEHQWGNVQSNFDALEKVDAALTDKDGRTFLFSGDQYIRYSTTDYNTIDEGYPRTIAGNWKDEEVAAAIPESFRDVIDAAFHGVDGNSYFFRGYHFLSSADMTVDEVISTRWGKIKNNLRDAKNIDAAYVDGEKIYIFSGDQVTGYRDSLENQGLQVCEGYPKSIENHFPNLPKEFLQGIDAAFKGTDGKIYLFKDEAFVGFNVGDTTITAIDIDDSTNGWGRIDNPLSTAGTIDAAFTGLEGKTYIFSGTQYFRYSGDDYSRVDTGYPRSITEDWGNLITIDAAFVLDGKTYLFGMDTNQKAMYIRYSTNDYSEPDEDYPKEQNDNWWNLPFSLTGYDVGKTGFEKVDAIFNTMDGKTFLFSGDKYIYFDHMHRWWSEPEAFTKRWDNITFSKIDAAFTGKDGKTYLFSGSEYIRFSDRTLTHIDSGYPRSTSKFWGNVKNNILKNRKMDAAIVVKSHVEEEKTVAGNTVVETVEYRHTYLFSGRQYVRYEGNAYDKIEPGYPRIITESLKDEPRFKNIDIDLDGGLDAAFADERNIYLFKDDTIYISSETKDKKYESASLPENGVLFMEEGALYHEDGIVWKHVGSLEGASVVKTPETPRWLEYVPASFKSGVDAYLEGTDENTYVFKGTNVFDLNLENTVPIEDEWGRVQNHIGSSGTIDAAFVGRDGKTYVFSGDQFVTYDGGTYIGQEIEEAPKKISEHWAGLNNVNIAYVLDGNTYLFEHPDKMGNFRVLRYSGDDYTEPDDRQPYATDISFWNLPEKYMEEGFDEIDAVLVDKDELLFICGDRFIEYDTKEDYWSYPKPLNSRWAGMAAPWSGTVVFEDIDAAFKAADGTIYFFKDESYRTYKNGTFTSPAGIKADWGIVPNILKNKVDAAQAYRGKTYLFSGDKYVRYSGSDYRYVDAEYPKLIVGNLRKEEGFESLPEEFDAGVNNRAALDAAVIISSVVVNEGNVYIRVKGAADTAGVSDLWFVASHKIARRYNIGILGNIKNNFQDNGTIDAAFVEGDKTYLFSGHQYIRYTGDKYRYIDDGYPKRITENLSLETDLGTVPTHFNKGIDAAFTGKDGNIYLFKDLKYYNSGQSSAGAVNIEGQWGIIKNNFTAGTSPVSIDAALIGPNGELYAFKGDQYIRYSYLDAETVDQGYPKPIENNWGNLPAELETGVNGAFTFEGKAYMIKGDQYVRYTDRNFKTIAAIFPQKFIDRWGDMVDYFLVDIATIARFKKLQDTYSSDYTLVDLLQKDRGYVKQPDEMLAGIFNYDVEEVRWLKRHNAFLDKENPYETRFNLEQVIEIFDALAVSQKMGTGISSLYYDVWKNLYDATDLDTLDTHYTAADTLQSMLGTKGCRAGSLDVLMNEIHGKLNTLKRDALVPYVIANDKTIQNARDLYEKLLLDVQMESCGKTSRIKEALAAVQLFFHRYFVNLEEVDLKGGKDEERRAVLKERWKWMRNYRVWEANRKVFLYPENYIRPELRDTKTPPFIAMEEELLQGEITRASAQRAFKKYLDEYTEVSRLKIAGGYIYDEPGASGGSKNLVLFGRTKTDPRRFYYRMAEFPAGGSTAIWGPWLDVQVKIDADRVYPVYAFKKVFVFWFQYDIKNENADSSNIKFKSSNNDFKVESNVKYAHTIKIYFSFYNLNKEWLPEQILKDKSQNVVVIKEYTALSDIKLFVESSENMADSAGNQSHENIVINCTYKAGGNSKNRAYSLAPELYSQPASKANFENTGHILVNRLLDEGSTAVGENAVVMLNSSEKSSDGPWFSFDHKGGSFLCKPTASSLAADAYPVNLTNNQDLLPEWTGIDAAFHYNGTSWFFNNTDRKYVTSDGTALGTEKSIQPDWGMILEPSGVIGGLDAAFDDGTHTYLFVGDQYYRQTAYDKIDDGYPKALTGNHDSMPTWQKVDAAFKGKDGNSYFFQNSTGKFISSSNTNKRDIKANWGVVKNTFTDTANTNLLDTAFVAGDKTYLMKDGEFVRYTGATYNVVDFGYAKQGKLHALLTDMDFTDLDAAWVGKTVNYLRVDGNTVYFSTTDGLRKKGVKSGNTTTWKDEPTANFPRTVLEYDGKTVSRKDGSDKILVYSKGPGISVEEFTISDKDIDAIFLGTDNQVYVFSGQHYMTFATTDINGKNIKWNAAGTIRSKWGKVDTNILQTNSVDAAVVIGDKTFLFSGDEYYRYTGATYDIIDAGYPKKIAGNTDNLPTWNKMDAALAGNDNTVYFFDRTDETFVTDQDLITRTPIDDRFGTKLIEHYETVDAAYLHNNHLFITSGNEFFRYTYSTAESKWKIDVNYPKTFTRADATPLDETFKIDAAFTVGTTAYLFEGDRYYKLEPPTKPDALPVPNFIQGNWGNIPYQLRSGMDAALMTGKELFLFKNENGRVDYIKYVGMDNPDKTDAIPYELYDSTYEIIRLTSSTAYKLNDRLFSGGIESLLSLKTQEIDELPAFTEIGNAAPTVIKLKPGKISKEPVSTHLDFNSANGLYYWEIFYHTPFLIAQSLNTGQKFEEAKEWYEYIFDPTETGTYWKFLPFLAVDTEALIQEVEETLEKIKEIETDLTLPSFDALATKLDTYQAAFTGMKELTETEITEIENLPKSTELTAFANGITTADGNVTDHSAAKPLISSLKEIIAIIERLPDRYKLQLNNAAQVEKYLEDPFDPHAIASIRRIAYRRAIVMAYIDNLVDWGDLLFTRYTMESIDEARMLYILAYDLLGKRPENVGRKILSDPVAYTALEGTGAEENSTGVYDFLFDISGDTTEEKSLTYSGTVHESVANPYFYIPENTVLLDYWERIEDRLYKIRHCLNIMGISVPLPLFQPPIDPMALVNAVAGGGGLGAALAGLSAPVPHYRFTFMLNKAKELASKLNQFGGDLLAAIEKKDAEELSLLQNKQEKSILEITRKIRVEQLEESRQNLKNLEATRESAEMQKNTYESWQQMLPEEQNQITMMKVAMIMHYITPVLKIAAGIANAIPDIKVGSPFSMGATTGGSTIGAALGFIAESLESISEGINLGGEISGIYAQFKRSVNDWKLQQQMAIHEMKQLDIQIEGARHAIKAAEYEIQSLDKEIENNESMRTFMKEKFSNEQLYRWMMGKLSGMFFQTYKLAHDMSRAAQRSLQFERGQKENEINYIGGAYWDSLKKGLLAGESLGLDLDRMEKEYIDTDARGFEITTRISLLELDPLAFLQLKAGGQCEFSLTEALFDYDFQGHYNRQIKTVSLILDAGEGVTVNATLTQLSSKTVMKPDAKAVKFLLQPKDAMPDTIRGDWRPSQQIVLSHVGEYDENNGLFELRYDDERYLPFEGTGAVSTWKLQLNGKKGSFDANNLKDVVIKLKYTADQGGDAFASSVKGLLKPYPTAIMVNMAEVFPNEWYAFIHDDTEDLALTITRDMFPNMSGSKISALYTAYQYEGEGKATLQLNDSLDLKHNKLLPEPGLSIGSKGSDWTFKAKGNKKALANMVMVLTYKATV